MTKEKKACERGCKGKVVNKHRGLYCPCIEAKLPKQSNQSLSARAIGATIEAFTQSLKPDDGPLSAKDILKRLSDYGLNTYERKLVYYVAVLGRPFKETVEKMGWVSVKSASYHYKKALKKLREGRFRFK